MGRQLLSLTAAALVALGMAGTTLGQGQPTPRLHPRFLGRPNPNSRPNPGPERFYQLSPDERQAFRRNAERWLQMNPEQQRILREREQVRRQRLKAEAEEAMRQMGLRLDPNAQGQFEARYLQERRRMERELRQEVEARRQQELPQLNERLKSEFQLHPNNRAASPNVSATVAPSTSAAPAGSAKPYNN